MPIFLFFFLSSREIIQILANFKDNAVAWQVFVEKINTKIRGNRVFRNIVPTHNKIDS